MCDAGCMANALLNPERMVELVEESSDSGVTMIDDFMEKNPNAIEGYLLDGVCPHWVGYPENDGCDNDCHACWNRKIEEE
jgi:hypothetical protein